MSQPPVALYWTRDGHVFTAKDRPGISLESEKVIMMIMMIIMMMMMMIIIAPAKVVSVSSSKLFISHVRLGDSANYSCVSDIARPDSIQLVVTQGATTQYKHNCPRLVSSPSCHFPIPVPLSALSVSCLLYLSAPPELQLMPVL